MWYSGGGRGPLSQDPDLPRSRVPSETWQEAPPGEEAGHLLGVGPSLSEGGLVMLSLEEIFFLGAGPPHAVCDLDTKLYKEGSAGQGLGQRQRWGRPSPAARAWGYPAWEVCRSRCMSEPEGFQGVPVSANPRATRGESVCSAMGLGLCPFGFCWEKFRDLGQEPPRASLLLTSTPVVRRVGQCRARGGGGGGGGGRAGGPWQVTRPL